MASEQVLEIAKWKTTFETAESRKYKSLNWVSVPVSFVSSGYQQMLEEFGDDAPAIYGAWIALVSFAATCPARGVLANSRGKALPVTHMARVTGFDRTIFERLITWALSDDIQWLVIAGTVQTEEIPEDFVEPDAPGESSGGNLERREINHATEPNLTRHNPAAASLAAAAAVETGLAGVDLETVRRKANSLREIAKALDRDWVWRLAAIGEYIDPDLLPAAVKRIKAREVSKPHGYLEKVFREECAKHGHEFKNLLRLAPSPPPAPAAGSAESRLPAPTNQPLVEFKRPPKPERGAQDLRVLASGSPS